MEKIIQLGQLKEYTVCNQIDIENHINLLCFNNVNYNYFLSVEYIYVHIELLLLHTKSCIISNKASLAKVSITTKLI